MDELLDRRPILIAIAGPNGAGKSTFYQTQLRPSGLPFVNADELALSLHVDSYRAAELADRIRRELVARQESFVFETVFSDPVGDKLAFLKDAAQQGYTVILFFIGIDGPEVSEERVTIRVIKGGHDVPADKIVARYPRVMANLKWALSELPNVRVYDNGDLRQPYRLVAVKENSQPVQLRGPVPEWLSPLLPDYPER